jgi:hypothetical protein
LEKPQLTKETQRFPSRCRVRRSLPRRNAAVDATEPFAAARIYYQQTMYRIKDDPTGSEAALIGCGL